MTAIPYQAVHDAQVAGSQWRAGTDENYYRSILEAAMPELRRCFIEDMASREGLLLPANPWGSAATWADYNWRRLSERFSDNMLLRRLCELVADALEQ